MVQKLGIKSSLFSVSDANTSTSVILKPKCREKSCACTTFTFVPTGGCSASGPFVKCRCKHDHDLHDVKTHKCSKFGCNCDKYLPTWNCSCGEAAYKHTTLVENRHQRADKGKRTEFGEVNGERHSKFGGIENGAPISSMYQALGGLTGHSSLADGIARFDTDAGGLYMETRRKLMLEEEQNNKSCTVRLNFFYRSFDI